MVEIRGVTKKGMHPDRENKVEDRGSSMLGESAQRLSFP
jgi:hypothetical protein